MTTRGRVRVEDAQKRVRVYLGGEVVADTTDAKLVWEKPYYPTYYFPAADVNTDHLVVTGETTRTPSRGEAETHTVKTAQAEAAGAARWYVTSAIDEISGHVSFHWPSMDACSEEDEQVYVHPRDPYTRIDILQSSRHIRVVVGGVTVADTHKPRLLFETDLPMRYYIPKTDVRLDLLESSAPHRHARTRERPTTTASSSTANAMTTSSGGTSTRSPRVPTLRATSRSTTKRSTSTSTASSRTGRKPFSADREPTPGR